jgi:hypothetical protein
MKAKQPQQPTKTLKEDDLRPDAWQRFERAVDAAAKAGPHHRPAQKQSSRKKKRPR